MVRSILLLATLSTLFAAASPTAGSRAPAIAAAWSVIDSGAA